MLTSAVLNILGRGLPEPEVPRTARATRVQGNTIDTPPAPSQELERAATPPYPGILRPLLPDLEDPVSPQRGFEVFLRALDEVERVNRRPELDVFE